MPKDYIIPRLPSGKIDYSKVDVHNDFMHFPAIFQTPDDIEKFIKERKIKVPALSNLLKLRKTKKLGFSKSEIDFYYYRMFRYIYDVYRIPVDYTWESTKNWLNYIEANLVLYGFHHFIEGIYEDISNEFTFAKMVYKFEKEKNLINYYKDIPEKSKYYNSDRQDIIEQFWIKTSEDGQPVHIKSESENYMRVWVFKDHVYIFGCDDCSYTFRGKNEEENKIFAFFLKTAVPIWNFAYYKNFHPKLEFTN